MTTAQKKVDREDVYTYIANLIKQSPIREVEISASQIAHEFGIKGPSMDYHLKNLIESGALILSDKRGSYNRKIYKLPNHRVSEIITPLNQKDLISKLKEIKNTALGVSNDSAFLEKKQEEAVKVSEQTARPALRVLTPLTHQANSIPEEKPIVPELPVAEPVVAEPVVAEPPVEEKKEQERELELLREQLSHREKTLDEKVNDFLERNNAIPKPWDTLKKDDREIIAVMNESIHQHILYMKDLGQQLSTLNDKKMIEDLIEERNANLAQIAKMEQELRDTYRRLNDMQLAQTAEESKLPDVTRVRMMQQLITSTIDQFVELPNHAMALGKGEFRKNVDKEIRNLVHYVLGMEK